MAIQRDGVVLKYICRKLWQKNIGVVIMKNYVQPEVFFDKVTGIDVLAASVVDLTEKDEYIFGSSNPWGAD